MTAIAAQCSLIKSDNKKYQSVKLSSIEVAERPVDGSEDQVLFFNPRSLESFDSEAMFALRESIRNDGLHHPPLVRAITADGTKTGEIVKIQLIAGERRYRSISKLVADNVECYDDQTHSMVPASILYEYLPCKVFYNISDEKALHTAFVENAMHQSLTTKEEIALVERLVKRGLKLDRIREILDTNITWVSQTANFRTALPPAAFEKLLDGRMARNVAVQILSYSPEDRARLYNQAVIEEEKERTEEIQKIDSELEIASDEEEIAMSEQDLAVAAGDISSSKQAQKDLNNVQKRIGKARERRNKIVSGAGVIKQNHIISASQKTGVVPKKSKKMLGKACVEQFYVNLLNTWLEKGKNDRILNQPYPDQMLRLMRTTATAILHGQSDPSLVLRDFLVSENIWEVPEGVELPSSSSSEDENEG